MNPIDIQGMLTTLESDPLSEAIFPFDAGGLAGNLYLELLENWSAIPEKTRSVMACVGASLMRQHYRELQAQIDAKAIANRLRRDK